MCCTARAPRSMDRTQSAAWSISRPGNRRPTLSACAREQGASAKISRPFSARLSRNAGVKSSPETETSPPASSPTAITGQRPQAPTHGSPHRWERRNCSSQPTIARLARHSFMGTITPGRGPRDGSQASRSNSIHMWRRPWAFAVTRISSFWNAINPRATRNSILTTALKVGSATGMRSSGIRPYWPASKRRPITSRATTWANMGATVARVMARSSGAFRVEGRLLLASGRNYSAAADGSPVPRRQVHSGSHTPSSCELPLDTALASRLTLASTTAIRRRWAIQTSSRVGVELREWGGLVSRAAHRCYTHRFLLAPGGYDRLHTRDIGRPLAGEQSAWAALCGSGKRPGLAGEPHQPGQMQLDAPHRIAEHPPRHRVGICIQLPRQR